MASTLERYFSQADLDRIEAAVKQAESATDGEIAVVLAMQSAGILRLGWLPSALMGLFVGIACLLSTQNSGWGMAYDYSLATLLGLGAFLATYLAYKLWWRRGGAQSTVWSRALAHFSGLSPTRAKTAVLVYVSLAERQVAVIADSGIAGKLPQNYWDATRDLILEGFRAGKQIDHLILAVEQLGTALASHFPRSSDDTDELPNRPQVT